MSLTQTSPSTTDGRILFHEGIRYYSPNSLVDACLLLEEPSTLDTLESNPFRPANRSSPRVRYGDFVQPRKWTEQFAWISFVPVVPSQWYYHHHSYLGRVLYSLPAFDTFKNAHEEVCGYQISPGSAWVQLESDLYRAVVVLSHHYRLQCVLPFLPNAVGYQCMFRDKKHLIKRLNQAREWFFVWFGALSFLVASVREPWRAEFKSQLDHQWASILQAKGLSITFIDGVRNSLVADSCVGTRRAGIILDIARPPPGQPHPSWFIGHGVPVWYRWSGMEESLAKSNPELKKLGPPQSLLSRMHAAQVSAFRLPRSGASNTATSSRHSYVSQQASRAPSAVLGIAEPSSTRTPLQTTQLAHTSDVHSSAGELDLTSPTTPALLTSPEPTVRISPGSPRVDGHDEDQRLMDGKGRPEKQDLEPEWISFFKQRESSHAKILAKETPKQRLARENRTKEPATTSAKVFEWYPSEEPGCMYDRIPVLAKARWDTLQDYGEAQKRYDPFFNEWDCCSQWGPDDLDDEGPGVGGSDESALDFEPLPSSVAATLVQVEKPLPPNAVSYIDSDHPTNTFMVVPQVDQSSDPNPDSDVIQEVNEGFGLFAGFRYPVPGTDVPSREYPIRDKRLFICGLGLDPNCDPDGEMPYFQTGHYQFAQQFFQALCSREAPLVHELWDLRDECPLPVRLRPRFKHIHLVHVSVGESLNSKERYYVFHHDGGEDNQIPWRLGVTSAADALLVCRLPDDSSPSDLASFFVGHGVPFRTFYPALNILRPPPTRSFLVHEIPKRAFAHRFTKEDYDAYVHMRTLLLGQPHMQAALKRGGIIWRLAVGTLGTSRVTFAPSLWGDTHRVDLPGGQFVDDILTLTELDLLCGAYECVSDDGKKRSLKSWWPLARYYDKEECGENYGRWTSRREDWYTKRLGDIESRDRGQQPLTYTEWKSSQHGPKPLRAFRSYVERSSEELLIARTSHSL